MPTLNPDILVWARTTAGLSLEEAAHEIELNDAHGVSGPQRLAALEAGKEEPSAASLEMAKAYRRSLLVFYLEKEPKTGDRGKDFRRLPGGAAPEYNPVLDALIRDIKGRQRLIKSLLEDAEAGALPFIGSAKPGTPAPELAARITKQLQFDLNTFREQKTIEEAFAYLRQKTEASRIFVLLLGNLRRRSLCGSDDRPFQPSILQKYSKAIDEFRRDAIRKLQDMRDECMRDENNPKRTQPNPQFLRAPNRWVN